MIFGIIIGFKYILWYNHIVQILSEIRQSSTYPKLSNIRCFLQWMLRMYSPFWIGLTKMKITADNNPDKIRIVIITMGTRHRFRLLRILERRGTVIFSASFAARSRLKVLSNGFLVAKAEMKPSSMLLLSISGWWDLCVCLLFLAVTVNTTSGSCSWCPGFFRVRLELFPPCRFFRFDFESLRLCCND